MPPKLCLIPFALPILPRERNVNFFLGLLIGFILSLNNVVSTNTLSNLIASDVYFFKNRNSIL